MQRYELLTVSDSVRDPQDVAIRLSVNGVRQQDGTTSQMIFSVAEQISAASR
jgi:2,4-didehydro-3-deoxy-L-rhamnonate hydrolase